MYYDTLIKYMCNLLNRKEMNVYKHLLCRLDFNRHRVLWFLFIPLDKQVYVQFINRYTISWHYNLVKYMLTKYHTIF